MPSISLRLSQTQMNKLVEASNELGLSTTSYVLQILFPNDKIDVNELTKKDVLTRVRKLERGVRFTIPSLFNDVEWQSYTNTVSIGRTFRIASKKVNSEVYNEVKFIEKRSGSPAVYEKK